MTDHDSAASVAAAILEVRHTRRDFLPAEIFSEPAWDLLLELFIADSEGLRLTAADVSQRCDIPPTLLSRWLKYLSKAGFVIGDGHGDLDDQLTLSGKGMESMERAISKARDLHSLLSKTT